MRATLKTATIQIILFCVCTSVVTDSICAQSVSKVPVIEPSNIIDSIRQKMKELRSLSSKELIEYANGLLRTKGYDYTFDWEPKGKQNHENLRKIGSTALPFSYVFKDVTGKKRGLQFLNADFGHPCFSVIDIPVTQVTSETFSIRTPDRQIKVRRPKDFYLEQIVLVDVRSRKPIRKWMVPIDATPVGISRNGMKIYFDTWEFYQNPYEEYQEQPIGLAVELSAEGALRFVDIADIPSDKGIDIDHDKKYTEIAFRKYKVADKEYLVKFSYPCT